MTRRDAHRGNAELTVFGRRPVTEALTAEGAEVRGLFVSRDRSPADRKEVRRWAHAHRVPCEEISRSEMTRRTREPRHDQGIAASVRLQRVMELSTFLDERKGAAARAPIRLLGLDGVTNSQNVGMVVRSVVGAGLDGLLWPMSGQPWVNGLVVRAAAGSLFACPILLCDSMTSAVATLQGAGFSVWGLDAGSPDSVFEGAMPHRLAFVLGGETEGLSAAVRGQLDRHVAIPMAGPLESLNVAVAAGLVAFRAAGLLGDETGVAKGVTRAGEKEGTLPTDEAGPEA